MMEFQYFTQLVPFIRFEGLFACFVGNKKDDGVEEA